MSDDPSRLFDEFSDDELVALYRRSPGEGLDSSDDTDLETEMRRRGLLPDREKKIPEELGDESLQRRGRSDPSRTRVSRRRQRLG